MKPLKHPTTAEAHAYMAKRQAENLQRCKFSLAETWANDILSSETGWKWKRQAQWSNRLFDFWLAELGCAIEIDGPEHNQSIDAYRDEYNFRRSAIVVLRVRNFAREDMDAALRHVFHLNTWAERRKQIGIAGSKKEIRRSLSSRSYPPSILKQYIAQHVALSGRRFVAEFR